MLTHLHIRDLALVDDLRLELGPGLNIFTGETGAGKSAVVGALRLLLGDKSSPEMIRGGRSEAVVSGRFAFSDDTPAFRQLERSGWTGGPILEVERTVPLRGRGRIRINGEAASRARLAEVLGAVVDMTGQHAHVGLLAPEAPLELLDGFAGLEATREGVARAHARCERLRRERDGGGLDPSERAQRTEFLRFALGEIEDLALEPDERAALAEERTRLRHAEQIGEGLALAEACLVSSEVSAVDQLGRAVRALDGIERFDAALSVEAERARSLLAEAEELGRAMERRSRGLEADPGRLDEVEARTDRIERMLKKYGGSEAELERTRARLAAELERLDASESDRAALDARIAKAEDSLRSQAQRLSRERAEAAPQLVAAVAEALSELSMAGTQLEVELRPLETVGAKGGERVELLMSPNRGEVARPLRKTASGGELARVLLAVKAVMAGRAPIATHVFDEIDTGIGGTVAESLGAKLAGLGRGGQVVAITHLAPVAAFADRHFRVRKVDRGERTCTEVRQLDPHDVLEELGRMLGGVGPSTWALAEELRHRAHGASVHALPVRKGRRRGAQRAVG